MRIFYLDRERALAGFALRYFVLLDRDRDAYLEAMHAQEPPEGDLALRNGESIRLEVDDQAHQFFVAVHLESRSIVTPCIPVPAGDEDVSYVIKTSFDKYCGMSIAVEPVKENEKNP